MTKQFAPNLNTAVEQLSREELNKRASNGMRGALHSELRDETSLDLAWESEQLAKSYGIYLEYNRAKTGNEKDWVYMIRVTIPGGGPLSKDTWRTLDDIANKYATTPDDAGASLRLTTRQNVQFHWIRKPDVIKVVQELAASGLKTLNGCGDNTRNVMACPLSSYSSVFNANAWARRIAAYFELPEEPFIQIFEIDPNYLRTADAEPREGDGKFSYSAGLLNRKFKIAVGAVHRDADTLALVADNCVELLTNDAAVAPVFDAAENLRGFQIYIGGGQGERNGKPGMAALAKPFALVEDRHLLPTLDAIVKVHQQWGDRQNRHWARLKYVVKKMGVDWFRARVQELVDFKLGLPLANHDVGARHLHHGWSKQADGLLTFGAFIENGRVIDNESNGKIKSAILQVLEKYPVEVVITPNQDLLFTGIPENSALSLLAELQRHGYGLRNGKEYSLLRTLSGACVGRNTCRLAYTDSEKFEPFLIDQLEERGWGDIATSIGVTGCERQCYRPATKAIGLVGSGLNLYQLKLMGTEDGRHQGQALVSSDGAHMYLRAIPREEVANVIEALFKIYIAQKRPDEELGYCFRRLGAEYIIEYLQKNPQTEQLMQKRFNTSDLLEPPSVAICN